MLFDDQITVDYPIDHSLKNYAAKNKLNYFKITASDILNGILKENFDGVLVISGGESKHCSKQLKNNGQDLIHDFIKNGGKYIGICRGKYWAGQEIIFNNDLTNEKINTKISDNHLKPLGLYSATSSGPINKLTDPIRKQTSSHMVVLKSSLYLPGHSKMDCPAVYNAGPVIDIEEDVEVLGYMTNSKGLVFPAVIEKKIGNGHMLSTSLHYEISGRDLLDNKLVYQSKFNQNIKSIQKHLEECAEILEKYDDKRQKCFNAILDYVVSHSL